jgi:O-antigen/teichoic acid export membrane protein
MNLRLTTQAGLLTASRASGQVLNALVGIVVVRHLSKVEYGTFRQVYLLAATMLQTELGFIESLYFFIPNFPKLRSAFIRQSVTIVALMQLLGGTFLLTFRHGIARFFNNPELATCLDLLAVYAGFGLITRIWEVELIAERRTPYAAFVEGTFEAFKVVSMFVALALSAGIRPLLWALVAANGLKFLAFLVFLGREFHMFADAGPLRQAMPQIGYAMSLWIPAMLNGAIGTQAHQYIVGHYFDPAQYAIYAVACFQIPFVGVLNNSITEVFLVRVTEYRTLRRSLELYDVWINACRKALLLFAAIVAVVVVLAKPIIVVLFTDRYIASAPLFTLMVIGLLFNSMFQDSIFRAHSAMKTYACFYVLRGFLSLSFAFIGLKLWGLWGVALSTILSIGIVNMLQLGPVARLLKVPFTRVLAWKDAGKTLMIASIAALATWIAVHTFASAKIDLVIGIPLFGGIYIALVIRLGLVKTTEVIALTNDIRSVLGPALLARGEHNQLAPERP